MHIFINYGICISITKSIVIIGKSDQMPFTECLLEFLRSSTKSKINHLRLVKLFSSLVISPLHGKNCPKRAKSSIPCESSFSLAVFHCRFSELVRLFLSQIQSKEPDNLIDWSEDCTCHFCTWILVLIRFRIYWILQFWNRKIQGLFSKCSLISQDLSTSRRS
nr:MAG TPA: hypothetical protein [Caudoviricetes sp.]